MQEADKYTFITRRNINQLERMKLIQFYNKDIKMFL